MRPLCESADCNRRAQNHECATYGTRSIGTGKSANFGTKYFFRCRVLATPWTPTGQAKKNTAEAVSIERCLGRVWWLGSPHIERLQKDALAVVPTKPHYRSPRKVAGDHMASSALPRSIERMLAKVRLKRFDIDQFKILSVWWQVVAPYPWVCLHITPLKFGPLTRCA